MRDLDEHAEWDHAKTDTITTCTEAYVGLPFPLRDHAKTESITSCSEAYDDMPFPFMPLTDCRFSQFEPQNIATSVVSEESPTEPGPVTQSPEPVPTVPTSEPELAMPSWGGESPIATHTIH